MTGERDTIKIHHTYVRNCEKHISTAKLSEPKSGTLQLPSPPNLSSFPRCLKSRPRYPIHGRGALQHLSPHLYCVIWSLFLFFPQHPFVSPEYKQKGWHRILKAPLERSKDQHTYPSSAIFPVLQLLLMRSLTRLGREARLLVSLIIEMGLSLTLEESGSLRFLSGCELLRNGLASPDSKKTPLVSFASLLSFLESDTRLDPAFFI